MKISTILLSLTATAMFVPTLAMATGPSQVTFQGEVNSQTCQAKINGKTEGTVLLPTVSTAELATKGATAGLTPFTISVTGCSAPKDADLKIGTRFLGYNVANGNLSNQNTSANGAKGVSIQLTQSAAGTTPVVLNGVTKVDGLVLPTGKTDTSYQFGARYIADDTAIVAGAVTAVAEYTLSYQ
ncbi:major type 1 subunit fimbrin (pilin) [Acinetobacter calcoaceticus]|uniref:Major type 1 subunit fimbrin (Pilin) n=1 Tax=Acinetobacter calcoaceticus TaxID=471 RepID=A0A4R1XB19_ACICA|nr:major type 1 subunit fimbrin (pilin) [Acinetobacter calcoaceticus]